MGRCRCRHLTDCHPERIALLYRYGQITSFEANAWQLTPGDEKDVNPFSRPSGKVCFDFENNGICRKNQEGKICRLHHYVKMIDKDYYM